MNFVDPFGSFKFSFDKVDRGYLNQDEIDLIYNKEFSSARLTQVRDMFIFSCYTFVALTNVCLIINKLQTNNKGIGNGLETTYLHHLHDSQSFQIAQCEDNIILRINQILIIKIIQIR